MATAEAVQSLQDEFRKVMDQAKTTQTSLQQLRSAKKEADVTKRRQEVLKSLKTVQTSMEQLQHDMQESEVGLEEALGLREEQPQHEDTPQQKQEEKKGIQPIGIVKTRKLTPQQQETLYELKASRMGAMQSQNQALKRELLLTQRKKHMLDARYAMTQSFSGSETLRAAHALEAKLRGANLKVKGLEDELRKSQQMSLRYRELYEDSQRQNEAENASRDRQRRSKSAPKHNDVMRAITPKPAPLKEQSFIGPNTNVNDVVRKNECLLEENDVQKREIQRLKRDNAELILIAKTSSTDRDTVLARLGTSETARQDVLKRYHKLKNEHSRVSRSFTRQAAEWIDSKKQHQHYGTQGRWDELRPVEPHGSRERFFEHSQQNQDSLPRQMYPVESYGGASKA
ncbi:spindle assembly abnormal protein 6 homolog [Littorina saxatilis]|uniref:Uncharacterized protein n=1 Tax=Littorina saxatilis TaxID=31220 RepID=A0AAN9GDH9_9CAEN